MNKTPEVILYTDGSSRGNPGPGGYGIILEWVGTPYKKEFSGGFRETTNNRMELLAVIEGLKKLKRAPVSVKVVSDSRYVVDAINKGWICQWERKRFENRKNSDLWKELLKQIREHQVTFEWIRGHNDHPQNERCDALAVAAAMSPSLPADVGFENGW